MRGSQNRFVYQALRVNSITHGKGAKDAWEMTIREPFDGSVDSHVWKILDNEKKYFREEWKKKVEYGKKTVGRDCILYIQADVRRASILNTVEESGARSQNQGGYVQQADRYGCKSGVVSNMQDQYISKRAGEVMQHTIT